MFSKTSFLLPVAFFIATVLLAAAPAAAQVRTERQPVPRSASVYQYADTDDVTIRVNVWGAVGNAGIYEVRKGIHLNELFSAAGGPNINVSRRADDQTIILKLVRETEGGGRQTVYEEVMDDEIIVSEQNPVLQQGDVLTVESYIQRGVDWRDVLSIGSSIVTLAITIVNFATR